MEPYLDAQKSGMLPTGRIMKGKTSSITSCSTHVVAEKFSSPLSRTTWSLKHSFQHFFINHMIAETFLLYFFKLI
jgi:hypothetical protein